MATTNTGGNGSQGKAGSKAGGAKKSTPKPTAGPKAGTKAGGTTAETGSKQSKTAAKGGAAGGAAGKAAGAGGKAGGGKSAGGKSAGGKTSQTGAKGGGDRQGGEELRGHLRDFVQRHPRGWGHGEWSGLIEELRGRGQDVSDTDALGMDLERERLSLTLEQISGVGPARVRSIADSFGRLYDLRQASVDEIAERAGVPRSVAEKVRGALH